MVFLKYLASFNAKKAETDLFPDITWLKLELGIEFIFANATCLTVF